MPKDNSMAKPELGIDNCDVSESDVLVDKVLINAAVAQVGVEDATIIKILLSRSNPDGKLFGFLNDDVLIQNISNSASNTRISSTELHVNPLPCMVHEAVSEGDVIDGGSTN